MTQDKLPPESPQQKAIYDKVKNDTCNIAVNATAGSGKTTTLIGIVQRIPPIKDVFFTSFGNAIVSELRSKVPPFREKDVMTLHSKGLSMIRDYFRGTFVSVKEDKYMKLAMQLYKEGKENTKESLTKTEFRNCLKIESICSFARMTLTPFSEMELRKMCNHYAIEYDEQILEYSMKLLRSALVGKGKALWVDFADMIYFPVKIPKMVLKKYDFVLLDEAQDTNNAQRELIELLLKPKTGRLISVGDDFQSIYGFQGANIDSFLNLRDRPNTITLPLSVSYRCPQEVIKSAQEINPDIQPYKKAKKGVNRKGTWEEIQEGDMVLSRTTKPILELYFQLVEKHIKATVVGKDIEEGLLDLAEKVMGPTKEVIVQKLNNEFEKLEKELTALGMKNPAMAPQYEKLEEKYELLMLIMSKVTSMDQIIPTIKKIFHPDKNAARLMTIHRSKGLQAERVFIVEKYKGEQLMPHKKAVMQWQKIQERNLMFVARTRSQSDMIFIDLRPEQAEGDGMMEEELAEVNS